MRSKDVRRALAVLVSATLVLGAFAAAPAEAKKKKKKPRGCATYVAGDYAEGAESSKVTNKATEEAPIEVELTTGPGLGFTSPDVGGDQGATSHIYHNVQVDSAAASAGLYVRIEHGPTWDYDTFLRLADGTAVAYEADFNPVGGNGLGSTEGGHAEAGVSQIDGYLAADCDGFTVDLASAITPGEGVTMKLWLGKPGG